MNSLGVTNCFFSALLTIAGFIFLCRGSFMLLKLRRIRAWEKARISILDSAVLTGYETIKYGWIAYFYPAAQYEYEINGQKISSDKVAFEKKGLWTENRQEAQELLDQIVANATAFYNPENIGESVIVPYLSKRRISHNWSLVVSGLMLIGLGVMFCSISAMQFRG